jgi:hypothetical protein
MGEPEGDQNGSDKDHSFREGFHWGYLFGREQGFGEGVAAMKRVVRRLIDSGKMRRGDDDS